MVFGGTGIQKLRKHGVHVIESVRKSHAVDSMIEYPKELLVYMHANAPDILDNGALQKQQGIMILMGANFIPKGATRIPHQLVYTDQQFAADIQELEDIAGIPVTIVPAHTEPIQHSLKTWLGRCKPRCVVLRGEGSAKAPCDCYFGIREGCPLGVTWATIRDVILEHNASFPEAPVLMVLVLACHGGTGMQKLFEDGVHVIGWCGK
eukprot:1781768-Amphidinium_carterae.1